jgi:anti-sigma factor RsiW
MTCHDAAPLIETWLDGELDGARVAELENHVDQCAVCRAARRRAERLSSAIRSEATRYPAPGALRARIEASLGTAVPEARPAAAVTPAAPAPRAPSRRWLAMAASFALGVAITSGSAVYLGRVDREQAFEQELVASHVRSLMPGHLLDVRSSDMHTVRPWFAGKLDFSPPVADFAARGFPLLGGRLDYLAGRPVASLGYGRNQHVINLYLWPSAGAGDSAPSLADRNGYNLARWTAPGWSFWAISDLNAAELRQFAELWRKTPLREPDPR